ncbi:MAG: AAA family ATPase [Victivallales bacterium]|nr:AAA family ATPase [Victivallales bacterium]
MIDVKQIGAKVSEESSLLVRVRAEMARVIVGQEALIDRLLMALLCNNHVLIEGLPGLAKTLTVTTLARCLDATYHRIQFTPDLLPADVVGTMIYNPKSGDFSTKKGPIFANIILADEINRAPAKVQSALLEAMQERQVTVGDSTFKLDDPFLVLATQNPVEQEGTYPLPEAQVDRFMFKVKVEYPEKDAELKILRRMASSAPALQVNSVLKPTDVKRLRELTDSIFMDEKIESYIVDLVDASRHPDQYGLKDIQELIRYGASPRATIFLAMASKA